MLQIPVTSDMQTHSLLNRILLVKWSQIFSLLMGKYIIEARGLVLMLINLLLNMKQSFTKVTFTLQLSELYTLKTTWLGSF